MPMFEDSPRLSSIFLKAINKGRAADYPFEVKPNTEGRLDVSKMGTWCAANIGKKGTLSRQGKWAFGNAYQGGLVVRFHSEEDAAFFKLTWG